MRRVMALVVIAALAGCAEVTRLDEPGGGTAYMVDCGSSLKLLESCRHAAERTCPDGYQVVKTPVSGPAGDRPIRGVTVFRCTQAPG